MLFIDGHAATLTGAVFEKPAGNAWQKAARKRAGRVVKGEESPAKLNIVILLLNFPTVSAMSFLTAMCSDIIRSTSALCRDTLSRSL